MTGGRLRPTRPTDRRGRPANVAKLDLPTKSPGHVAAIRRRRRTTTTERRSPDGKRLCRHAGTSTTGHGRKTDRRTRRRRPPVKERRTVSLPPGMEETKRPRRTRPAAAPARRVLVWPTRRSPHESRIAMSIEGFELQSALQQPSVPHLRLVISKTFRRRFDRKPQLGASRCDAQVAI